MYLNIDGGKVENEAFFFPYMAWC